MVLNKFRRSRSKNSSVEKAPDKEYSGFKREVMEFGDDVGDNEDSDGNGRSRGAATYVDNLHSILSIEKRSRDQERQQPQLILPETNGPRIFQTDATASRSGNHTSSRRDNQHMQSTTLSGSSKRTRTSRRSASKKRGAARSRSKSKSKSKTRKRSKSRSSKSRGRKASSRSSKSSSKRSRSRGRSRKKK